ncbi:hypothetical protein MUK42_15713 [Musa troglodytarum]|uniref:Uncharacterized protein n=1 Tax=Musa troglodytarum TaxID=320322 RepID=A0A9E7HMJ1_9LILI|nr:hypothetical protein MUK42_15713 [Musa troglodytarum]
MTNVQNDCPEKRSSAFDSFQWGLLWMLKSVFLQGGDFEIPQVSVFQELDGRTRSMKLTPTSWGMTACCHVLDVFLELYLRKAYKFQEKEKRDLFSFVIEMTKNVTTEKKEKTAKKSTVERIVESPVDRKRRRGRDLKAYQQLTEEEEEDGVVDVRGHLFTRRQPVRGWGNITRTLLLPGDCIYPRLMSQLQFSHNDVVNIEGDVACVGS